jgi:hypothetical protein
MKNFILTNSEKKVLYYEYQFAVNLFLILERKEGIIFLL